MNEDILEPEVLEMDFDKAFNTSGITETSPIPPLYISNENPTPNSSPPNSLNNLNFEETPTTFPSNPFPPSSQFVLPNYYPPSLTTSICQTPFPSPPSTLNSFLASVPSPPATNIYQTHFPPLCPRPYFPLPFSPYPSSIDNFVEKIKILAIKHQYASEILEYIYFSVRELSLKLEYKNPSPQQNEISKKRKISESSETPSPKIPRLGEWMQEIRYKIPKIKYGSIAQRTFLFLASNNIFVVMLDENKFSFKIENYSKLKKSFFFVKGKILGKPCKNDWDKTLKELWWDGWNRQNSFEISPKKEKTPEKVVNFLKESWDLFLQNKLSVEQRDKILLKIDEQSENR